MAQISWVPFQNQSNGLLKFTLPFYLYLRHHASPITFARSQSCASSFACHFFVCLLSLLHFHVLLFFHTSKSIASLFWFEHTSSELSDIDKGLLNPTYEIPSDHGIHFPTTSHLPPPGYTTFFLDQVWSGLRFPISPFLLDIAIYLCIRINQFTSNTFLLLYSVVINCPPFFVRVNWVLIYLPPQ